MAHTDFALASASVTGRDHRNINVHRNNQDGYAIIRQRGCTVAVVTDGCGSGAHSEVGAKIGARLIAEAVARQGASGSLEKVNLQQVSRDVLAAIHVLARQMGGNYPQVIQDYFLFTAVGAYLMDWSAQFFALGDGVVILNDEIHRLGPFPGNQPPYLAYSLIREYTDIPEDLLEFQEIKTPQSCDLDHFLIGTDGVNDLIAAGDLKIPGMTQKVGNISQFWEVPAKSELVERRLRVISRDWPRHDPEPGLLPDDTTLIVGRRM